MFSLKNGADELDGMRRRGYKSEKTSEEREEGCRLALSLSLL